MHNMSVSVIIPCYNSQNYIVECIKSVLINNCVNMEIIVIDDGSQDKTVSIIRNYFGQRVKIIENGENKGASYSRNIGLKYAKSEYIAFIDSDDLWIEGKLKKQLKEFILNPKLELTFCHIEQFISHEISYANKIHVKNKVLPGYCASAMLAKKELFDKVGMFSLDLMLGEFIEWFLRVKKIGISFLMMEELLVLRRLHNNNTSFKNKQNRRNYLHIAHQYITGKNNNVA